MIAATTAPADWMSADRRALVATIDRLLANLHADQAWWRDTAGELLCYRGPDVREAEVLMCAAAAYFTKFGAAFDIALDWLLDARNPLLSDTAARSLVPLVHGQTLRQFHAEAPPLALKIADWRQRHAAT